METAAAPTESSAPVVTTTRCLKPTHAAVLLVCSGCNKPQAHWTVRHPRYGEEEQNICALCFFKTSGWADGNKERLRLVINAISMRSNSLVETNNNLPVHVKDADNILGAIALHERFEALGLSRGRKA